MTEKLYSLNLVSPLIGNPTLISSTLSTHPKLASAMELVNVHDSNRPISDLTDSGNLPDMDPSVDLTIPVSASITAQLKMQILPISTAMATSTSTVTDTNASNTVSAINSPSILLSSQVSTTSSDMVTNGNPNNSMALVKVGCNKPPMVAQNIAGICCSSGRGGGGGSGSGGGGGGGGGGSGGLLSMRNVKKSQFPVFYLDFVPKSCRFPKLEECAHFHYERVQLGPLTVRLIDDKSDLVNSSIASQSICGDTAGATINMSNGGGVAHNQTNSNAFTATNCWFIIKVLPHHSDAFFIKRSFDNVRMLDEMLHRCVYDRKISGLKNLDVVDFKSEEDVEYAVAKYLERFSKIASDSLTCGTILTWFQLDNKGRRLPLADGDTMRSINTPAVGAAYGVRRYQAQASDEISIEVGDMISVIDMPSPAESIWWRGKKSHLQKSHYEVGFFPQSCVATIGDKVPRHFPLPAPLVGQVDISPTKPVLRKHGKLIAFFRSFILSRPSRRRLKQTGIYRERVFSCDLSEHLLNSGQEIPMVLKCCAEFIEEYGIVDGIYRLSGITSNIQRLRQAFDEERVPDLGNPEMKQDIHAVSSLLKMYFRELPNPLCTYQLYDNFVEAIQTKGESSERLRLMKETVLKLPPPHYRTLKYLSEHLNKICQHAERTGMTDKNLAIVWAPNLLRSPALESGGVAALRGVGVQAVVTEYLIKNCYQIFDGLEDANIRSIHAVSQSIQSTCADNRTESFMDCESLLVEQREHDQLLLSYSERPKSLSAGGAKLISLEEAQERHLKVDNLDMKQSMPINMINSINTGHNIGSYIEVGGGPSSLPDKYHTVLSVPRSWQKRKTHSWKSLFTRQQRPVSNGAVHDLKTTAAATLKNQGDANITVVGHSGNAQVTFDDVGDGITTLNKKNAKVTLNRRDDKHKSIEIFETSRSYSGEPSKPIELRVRSNSIDSLRVGGHSRSVSHDSYFDLLQSPQRTHVNTCPSRELSELGLNFDREEPEMRIFSESESLVSSPRVGKENIPPSSCATLRRIMRARPEEYSSQTNSVNPSPKKQPRLNLLLSPDSAANANWSPNSVDTFNTDGHIDNESCSKRYKLEDQLSDIQYIDSGTPEHIVCNSSSLYSSAQISSATITSPPLYTSKDNTTQKIREFSKKLMISKITNPISNTAQARYSYPSVPLGSKRKEQDYTTPGVNTTTKERFSYPGSIINDCHYYSKQSQTTDGKQQHDMKTEVSADNSGNQASRNVTFGGCQTGANAVVQHLDVKSTTCDLLKVKNRKNLSTASDQLQQQICEYSTEYLDANVHYKNNDDFNKVKLTVTTPTSPPIQSPRYSLLVGGDTSSENSSNINTPPQHELEPLMLTSAVSALSGISTASSNQMPLLLNVDNSSCLGTSRESLSSNLNEKRDMQAVKRELSLDLNTPSTKLTATESNLQTTQHRSAQNLVSPNNSNFTDNTSQSVTPSEFGYQNLHRQLSMHSLIETDDNSPVYEEYESANNHLSSPMKLSSPMRATINITYNMKNPSRDSFAERTSVDHKNHDREQHQPQEKELSSSASKSILETCFDDTIIYEKVKFLRNSVTEINQLMMSEDRGKYFNTELENLTEVEELSDCENSDALESQWRQQDEDNLTAEDKQHLIPSTHDDNDIEEDNLVNPNEKNLLYENVNIRKPASIYQNLMGEDMKSKPEKSHLDAELELDSLDSIKEAENEIIALTTAARRSPSNLSVKELATKFETSPVEHLPAFDFTQISRNSIRKPLNSVHAVTAISRSLNDNEVANDNINTKPPKPPQPSLNQKTKLRKAQQQITRSLDEDAFVREFNTKNTQDLANNKNKSLQQVSASATYTDLNNRRKSFDFTRPKTLNPPKRLPGVPISEEALYMNVGKQYSQKNDLSKHNSGNMADYRTNELEKKYSTYNENSALQSSTSCSNKMAGNTLQKTSATAVTTTLPSNNLHVLSGVKLDRERIDRIKEERRQQLTQKYHTDLLKSKSKTDLNTYRNEEYKFDMDASLRIKSKSRADMHTLQKDIDNLKEFGRNPPSTAVSETTLNTIQRTTQRSTTDVDKSYSSQQDSDGGKTGAKDLQQYCSQASSLHNNLYNSYQMEDFGKQRAIPAQKFERKSVDFVVNNKRGERQRSAADNSTSTLENTRSSINNSSIREKISPQFSIKDVTAMFESRSQHQQSQQQ